MGSGGTGNLPPLPVAPIRYALPVSILSVHQKPVAGVELWENLAAGRGGGFQERFVYSLVLPTFKILWICFNIRQQAGSWGTCSGLLLWCYDSWVTLSSEPSACIIFQELFCVKAWVWQLQAICLAVPKISLTLELITDSSVHSLILTTIYLQSQVSASWWLSCLCLRLSKVQHHLEKEAVNRVGPPLQP